MCAVAKLPARAKNAYKQQFGHILVVGGDYGYFGAPILAGLAAMRSGAGLVTIGTRSENSYTLPSANPELMAIGLTELSDLESVLSKASVIIIGPGLGRNYWGREWYYKLIDSDLPVVVDADALFFLAEEPIQRQDWVITPHPGEARALLGQDITTDNNARMDACRKLADKYQTCAVLKGAGTLVATPNTTPHHCEHGNPAMATAGMGDVLTGIIAALIAQGLAVIDAATLAVEVHAKAGDLAAHKSQRGMLARDVLSFLPELLS